MTDPIQNSQTNTATSTVQQAVDHARGLEGQIAETGYRNGSDRLDLWRRVFWRPPPKHLSLQFMRRVLIWEMQNTALNGVSAKTTRRLRQMVSGKALPAGEQPGGLISDYLIKSGVPASWSEQRERFTAP